MIHHVHSRILTPGRHFSSSSSCSEVKVRLLDLSSTQSALQ